MQLAFKTINDQPGDLDGETIDLWSAALDGPADDALLTPSEFERASRFRLANIRNQFVSARGQLRIILGRYLGVEPRAVPITVEHNGKPILDPSLGSGLHFNVSHSEALAVYAVTQCGRVGVDVERPRYIPNAEGLVERFFTPRERVQFFALAASERQPAFFRAWTRKEAVLKAIGRGVQALDQCDVTFGPDEPEQLLRLGDDTAAASQWFLRSWQPQADYVAAVAVQRST